MAIASQNKGKATQEDRLSMSDALVSRSGGSSSPDTASDSESESEDEITREYLDSLLEKARGNAREARKRREVSEAEARAADEGWEGAVITLDDEKVPGKLPDLHPGSIPNPYFTLSRRSEAPLAVRDLDAESALLAGTSKSKPSAPAPPPETTRSGKFLTKKEKKALRRTTAGSDWFDLPAPDPADLPRLHREVEALRLRNTLDPKRFYRKDEGEGRGIKGLPKYFAIGTVVATGTPFGNGTSDNLTRAERKRTIVDELVDDAEAKRYAKRKFEDLQGVRGAKGRGTLTKKNALRQKKW